MIIVTGGAGFIGSNLVKNLNEQGRDDILVVDNLENGHKFVNLIDCEVEDYWNKEDFIQAIQTQEGLPDYIEAIFHLGACSSTTEWNGRYMMKNNFTYSKILLDFCMARKIPFIYASSAATYGNGRVFVEEKQYEKPLNVYGYSKFLFDQYVRRVLPTAESQIVGMRYFNVYGPREQHKGSMSSVAFHFNNQMKDQGVVKLFAGTEGYGNGEQCRDFVYVEDVVDVKLWFWQHPDRSGIFNVGTGRSQTFNEVANAVIDWYGKGKIDYIPFPEHLKGAYQSYTQADTTKLRAAGCDVDFKTVEEGVKAYLNWMNAQGAADA